MTEFSFFAILDLVEVTICHFQGLTHLSFIKTHENIFIYLVG